MSNQDNPTRSPKQSDFGRRGFLYTVVGGLAAALASCVPGGFTKEPTPTPTGEPLTEPSASRISALEAKVAQLELGISALLKIRPLGQLAGANDERVVFNKNELTVINPEGVLLNLVATHGPVGIRFYKDFGFGNEQVTNPWHMGYIEGKEGYEGLAILRDWRFTAALWDEDGKLTLGRLDPYPPGNEPAKARVHIRGTLDEVQAVVEANSDQTADIFQVIGHDGSAHLTVDSEGNAVLGSHDVPSAIILHDTENGDAYDLKVTNGQLTLTRI